MTTAVATHYTIDAPSDTHGAAATPYIADYLRASGLTMVHDAYPFAAWEHWQGSTRYYLISAKRSKIDSLDHPVDIDVLEPVTPALAGTRNLCRGVPLCEAVRLFVTDTVKQVTNHKPQIPNNFQGPNLNLNLES